MPLRRYALTLLLLMIGHPLVAQGSGRVDRMAWLAGCWEQRSSTRLVQEQWMAPVGGMMFGTGRTVTGGVTGEWEFLRIVAKENGLSYIAMPGGQRETGFTATSVTDTSVVFENPAHDFPQRISYRRISPDSISARVSGTVNGRERGTDIPMRRVATCGP